MDLQLKWLEKNGFEALGHIPGNRNVNPTKVRTFFRDLRKNDGKLPATKMWAIVVNAKNQVVDGQNRLAAVRMWNEKYPKKAIQKIPYFLDPGAGLEEAKKYNAGKDAWKEKELIQSWKDLGHPGYAELEAILATDDAKKIGAGLVYKICMSPDTKNPRREVKNGTFNMWRKTDDKKGSVQELMRYVADVKDVLAREYGPSDIVVPLFIACLQIPDVESDHLCRQLHRPDSKTVYTNRKDLILETFNRLYNAGAGSRTRKRVNLVDHYAVVQGYNARQQIERFRTPTLRETDPVTVSKTDIAEASRKALRNSVVPPKPAAGTNYNFDGLQ